MNQGIEYANGKFVCFLNCGDFFADNNVLGKIYEVTKENDEAVIKERAVKDGRIKFLGFLPSRKDLLLKQKQATMMINTRKPDEAASAYCFPSKLFEYI